MNTQEIKESFWKNGYAVIRNVYTDEQILRFRNFIKDKGEEITGTEKKDWRTLKGEGLKDVLSYEELRDAILNKKLLQTIKHIYDDEDIYYWGYSRFRYNEKTYRNTHNDAKNDNNNPFKTKYPILRVGIYLQDHKNYSDGLKIFKKSCHTLKLGRTLLKTIIKQRELRYLLPQRFSSVNIDSQAGDVILWNLRTCHSANAVRMRFIKNISVRPTIENFLEKYFPKLLLPRENDRAVIFSDFGKMSETLVDYLKHNLKQPGVYNPIKNSNFLVEEIISRSKELGLNILDIRKYEKE
tara:strand:- start:1402 stop:2289 length:888 start_codon:yes stop_codon:yes gene_type:complete